MWCATLRSCTLAFGRCSALCDLRGARELPGQIECASVASPAVDEELLGNEKKEGIEEGRNNLRVKRHHQPGGEQPG